MKYKILFLLLFLNFTLGEAKTQGIAEKGVASTSTEQNSLQETLKKLKEIHDRNVMINDLYNIPASPWSWE